MTWDKVMAEQAAKEGWRLTTTINNGSTHPFYDVVRMPTSGFKDDKAALHLVLGMANRNSPLHRHAMHLITTSRVQPKAEPKAKRK